MAKKYYLSDEGGEQEALVEWANRQACVYPCLKMLFHIPNGGKRDKIEAAKLKRQGVKAGVPDMCLPFPSGKYHGLYFEMKYGTNKPTPEQKEFLKFLDSVGYKTGVCYSSIEAIELIKSYLKEGKQPATSNSQPATHFDFSSFRGIDEFIDYIEKHNHDYETDCCKCKAILYRPCIALAMEGKCEAFNNIKEQEQCSQQ